MLNGKLLKQLTDIVGSQRVLVSAEDIYVYSFEKLFEDRRRSKLDAVLKTTSEAEIAEIAKLAKSEGLVVLRRSGEAAFEESDQTAKGVVLLDSTSPPDIAAFDERLGKGAAELSVAKRKLMDVMQGRERSYKSLATAVELLLRDRMILRCEACDVCTGYCAVSPHFDHIETWSAKGRYLLTRGFMNGEVNPSKRLRDILYSCTLCGSCFLQCIPAPHIHEAILEARGKMARAGWAPESTQAALRNIQEYGNPLGASANQRVQWMTSLPPDSLSEAADVLYWVGCNTALRSRIRGTALASINVLTEAGVTVTTLGAREGCCGVPAIFGGLFNEAERNAERVVEAIEEAKTDTVVTSCSGCYETFVNFYPNQLDIELPCEVLHMSQLVEHLIQEGRLSPQRLNMKVAYHDPCGLGRHCEVYDAPRNILSSIPDLQLVDPLMSRERSRCCGGGGGFWGVNSNASMNLAHLRIAEDIAPLKVNVLATTCPLCYTNFLYTSIKHSLGIEIRDVTEILDMALRRKD